MLRTVILLLTLALAPASHAAPPDRGPQVPDYPVDKVAAHTYVIHGPIGYPSPENQGFMNNPAFVVTEQGVVVIDPGSSVQTGQMVLRQIRKITDKPVLAVLNTHVHGDHWLGNHAFREADSKVTIYGHPEMIAAVKKGAGEFWVGNMEQMTRGATRGTRPMGPNRSVKNRDEVKLGGFTFRFIHPGQAHTNNDLMIEVVEDQLLFLADNVCNQRIVRMDDGSFPGSVAAIDAVRKMPFKVLVPGHGRTGGWEMVDAYRDYLNSLYKQVGKYYEEGMSDFEMKPKVAEDLDRFKHWPGFADELGKHISLAVLEHEQRAFR